MILGIDLGYSSTKIVILDKKRVVHKEIIENSSKIIVEKKIKELIQLYSKINKIGLTGGKSEFMKLKFSAPVKKVSEVQAISSGGLYLACATEGIVISCGTGTCITYSPSNKKEKKIAVHLGGTGVGGGTIYGLAKIMIGSIAIKDIEKLSRKGFLSRVDLLIGDILGNSVGFLPKNITASNFGKCLDCNKNDIAKGILNLVAETIASIAVFSARSVDQKRIILIGRVPKINYLHNRMRMICRICKIKAILPKNGEYGTAIGAALNV